MSRTRRSRDGPEVYVASLFDDAPPRLTPDTKLMNLKEGRVKVAVRCRPAFEDELEDPLVVQMFADETVPVLTLSLLLN